MPVPRWSFTLALGLLLLLPAHTLAGPAVGGVVHGTGAASAIKVVKTSGETVQGGLYQWTLLCVDCFLNVTLISSDMTVVQNGVAYPISPGTYQVREFQGAFSYTARGPGYIDVRIEGTGFVWRV